MSFAAMLTFFRSFFKSKIGLGLTFAFLGLIAFAFASADVSSTGMFGGVAGGNRVAVVGDERIDSAELSRATSSALDRVRQEDPTLSMPAFIAGGGFEEVLNQLIDRYVISAFARDNGLRAGDNLINSEIQTIGAFRGADGNFDENTYRQALAAQGLTDAQVRDDIRSGLLAQQIAGPAAFGAVMPQALAKRYAGLFRERREGA
ncbi:MAG: SurA N-terminal domain-containing protein, partial [Pseudomonadota bacterium]|nr:SurA N-terminal domain-containing protein [Pseudomonadota bacterium]